jgi:hypothetical protein
VTAITEIAGRKRNDFVEEGQQSGLITPQRISDADLYLETNFSANDCIRKIEQVMAKYRCDMAELEVFAVKF